MLRADPSRRLIAIHHAQRPGRPTPGFALVFAGITLAFALLLPAQAVHAQSTRTAATRFTPTAGGDAVKKFVESPGNTPEERQKIL